MLQYFLNSTAIWLISLVGFDIFLRRESYHSYNRFYLLLTFMSGVFLPLWHWGASSHLVYASLQYSAEQVILVKRHIEAAASAVTKTEQLQWLKIIYLSGAFVALSFLLIDIIRLGVFYSKGKKSKQNNWIIVTTHKEHAPFSFLNILFVSSRKLYNNDEWDMLLVHEQQHRKLIHFADVILIQVARILFWFNPLVYIYNKRLLLVHEYQADDALLLPPGVYGKFLVEQTLLQSAPSIAHALSNSPVKSRILMLTHRSSRYRHLTKLLVFPLIVLFMVCFTRYDIDYQLQRNENIVYNERSATPPGAYENAGAANQFPDPGNENSEQQNNGSTRLRAKELPKSYFCTTPHQCDDNRLYLPGNDKVILLAGMENNTNAKCCSSNLLWGSNCASITVTEGFPAYAQVSVYLPVNNTYNPCTQGFDMYRKDQYTQVVAAYRHMQESWDEYHHDNSIALIGGAAPVQIVVADDPWRSRADKSPGMVPQLSIDRSVFGQNARTIFDNATAMANPAKEKPDVTTVHDWFTFSQPGPEIKTAVGKTGKSNVSRTKNTSFTP